MVFVISIFLFLLCLIKKESKAVFAIVFIWLWILMAFSSGNADEITNQTRYYNLTSYSGMTEIGYKTLMGFFAGRGVPFEVYKCIISFVELLLIGSSVWKLTKNKNLVLALYFLFPFCMDVVQMRNTMGLSIVIFVLRFLVDDNNLNRNGVKRKVSNDMLYLIGIIIASCFHFANIIYLILLLAKRMKLRTLVFSLLGISMVGLVLINPVMLVSIGEKIGLGTKVKAILASTDLSNNALFHITLNRVVIYFIMFLMTYYFIVKRSKRNDKLKGNGLITKDLALKVNIAILIIIPLMQYSVDFYRCQIGLSIFNYAFFSGYILPEKLFKIKVSNVLLISWLYVGAIINLYLLVLGNNNIHTVFWPLFNNNTLF